MLITRNNPTLGELKRENEYLKKLLRDRYELNIEELEFNLRQERISQIEKLPFLDDNESLILKISNITGVKIEEIKGKSKVTEITTARFACYWALRRINLLSLKTIGRLFGTHHTSVMYGIKTFENHAQFKHNPEYQLIKSIQTV